MSFYPMPDVNEFSGLLSEDIKEYLRVCLKSLIYYRPSD
ncbi:hypothetical protein NIES3585_44990 [Nodularia sp. NIES-3585]|nr:hypothetical protein NIES3585_44990 [Nodularia sp. NIES-3585]